MQSAKSGIVPNSQVLKDNSYKMEDIDNCETTDGEYENVELVSKSGDSLLISLVQNYPHLYVKTPRNQKDHSLGEKSWQEISAILEQPASKCLKRWTRLRERYSKEKRLSEQNLRNGVVPANRSGWPHYGEMGFLAQHVVRRRSYRNIEPRRKRDCYERSYSNDTFSPADHQSLSSSPAPITANLLVLSPSPSPSRSTEVVPSSQSLPSIAFQKSRVFLSCDRKVKKLEFKKSIPGTTSTAADPSVASTFPAALEIERNFRNCDQKVKGLVNDDSIPETTSAVNNNSLGLNNQIETSEDLFCKYLASELKKMSENEKKAATRRLMNALFKENT